MKFSFGPSRRIGKRPNILNQNVPLVWNTPDNLELKNQEPVFDDKDSLEFSK